MSTTTRSSRHAKEGIPKSFFCGKAAGKGEFDYPVNTPGRAIAALSYARYAPNQAGLKKCVERVAKREGWYDADAKKIRRKPVASKPTKRVRTVKIDGQIHHIHKHASGRVTIRKAK